MQLAETMWQTRSEFSRVSNGYQVCTQTLDSQSPGK